MKSPPAIPIIKKIKAVNTPNRGDKGPEIDSGKISALKRVLPETITIVVKTVPIAMDPKIGSNLDLLVLYAKFSVNWITLRNQNLFNFISP